MLVTLPHQNGEPGNVFARLSDNLICARLRLVPVIQILSKIQYFLLIPLPQRVLAYSHFFPKILTILTSTDILVRAIQCTPAGIDGVNIHRYIFTKTVEFSGAKPNVRYVRSLIRGSIILRPVCHPVEKTMGMSSLDL